MRRMVIVDDFDHTQIADTTQFIGVNGKWVQLDLTNARAEILAETLKPWYEAGEQVDAETVRKKSAMPTKSEKNKHRGRDWNKQFRAWADANGRTYSTASGGFYAKNKDVDDYEAYLADLASREEGRNGGTSAA